jgi:hypothetical protein
VGDKTTTIPKAGIFAEGEAKIVSQQIIDEIKNTNSKKVRWKRLFFMETD